MTIRTEGHAYTINNEHELAMFLNCWRQRGVNPLACYRWRIA